MKTFRILIAILTLVLLAEVGLFVHLLNSSAYVPDERVDLIAVFVGAPARTARGLTLAREGRGAHLVISPSDEKGLDRFRAQLEDSGCRALAEPHAVTTYENAHYVSQIIREHGFDSVILVTSWYHMPRAYLLLRLHLLGSGTKIIPCVLGQRPAGLSGLVKSRFVRKEFIKFWGSLAEWGLKGTGVVEMGKTIEFRGSVCSSECSERARDKKKLSQAQRMLRE